MYSMYKEETYYFKYSILDLLGNLGGLFTGLFALFKIIGAIINRTFLYDKILRAVYYVSIPDHNKPNVQ